MISASGTSGQGKSLRHIREGQKPPAHPGRAKASGTSGQGKSLRYIRAGQKPPVHPGRAKASGTSGQGKSLRYIRAGQKASGTSGQGKSLRHIRHIREGQKPPAHPARVKASGTSGKGKRRADQTHTHTGPPDSSPVVTGGARAGFRPKKGVGIAHTTATPLAKISGRLLLSREMTQGE